MTIPSGWYVVERTPTTDRAAAARATATSPSGCTACTPAGAAWRPAALLPSGKDGLDPVIATGKDGVIEGKAVKRFLDMSTTGARMDIYAQAAPRLALEAIGKLNGAAA